MAFYACICVYKTDEKQTTNVEQNEKERKNHNGKTNCGAINWKEQQPT